MEDRKKHVAERAEAISDHLELPDDMRPHVEEHVDELLHGRAPVIWLQGQNCTGCSCALMDSDHFAVKDLGLKNLSLRYHPTLMGPSGTAAESILDEEAGKDYGKYILVVEGAVPTSDEGRYCTFGLGAGVKDLMGREVPTDKTMLDWLEELVPGARGALMVGNCASFGGIPAMKPEVTGARAAADIILEMNPKMPLAVVSGCPPHPDWIIGTLVEGLLWLDGHREGWKVDDKRRLMKFYEKKIHDLCERRPQFEAKQFLANWNESRQEEDRCLLHMGCKGPGTHGDCPVRLWNSRTNWCVGVNAPCQGCTEPDFQDRLPKGIHKPKA